MSGSQTLRSASTHRTRSDAALARRALGGAGEGLGGDVGRDDLPAVGGEPDRLGAGAAPGVQCRARCQAAGLTSEVRVRRVPPGSAAALGLLPVPLPVVLVESSCVMCAGPRRAPVPL